MGMQRIDITPCSGDCNPLSTEDDGEYCRVEDVVDELRRRIAVTNTLPAQQAAYQSLLEWINGRNK